MTKPWRGGVILSSARLLAGRGIYLFQGIIARCLGKVKYGRVTIALGFVGRLGLPLVIASAAVTHQIAHSCGTGLQSSRKGRPGQSCQTGPRWAALSYPDRPSIPRLQLSAQFDLEATATMRQIPGCQGPWTVDLRTPPGPEGSNGSLLRICRGHPGTI